MSTIILPGNERSSILERENNLQRIRYLQTLISKLENALEKAPQGRLKAVPHGKGWQYYSRNFPDDAWHYIRKKDLQTARKFGQKIYFRRVLDAARRELAARQMLRQSFEKGDIDSIYKNMAGYYQDIVQPLAETDEQFLAKWKASPGIGNPYYEESRQFLSKQHEKMRSKSETIIANLLYDHNIPYLYEKPLLLNGHYGKPIYPDFTLMDFERRTEIYWEHLGLLDDRSYRENAIKKIRLYEDNDIFPGDRLIITAETYDSPLDIDLIEKQIQRLGMCAIV